MVIILFPCVYEYGETQLGATYWFYAIGWLLIDTTIFLLILKKYPSLLKWFD
jgi:hypothetical protein